MVRAERIEPARVIQDSEADANYSNSYVDGNPRVHPSQLQRRDQRLRERWAVAARIGVAKGYAPGVYDSGSDQL